MTFGMRYVKEHCEECSPEPHFHCPRCHRNTFHSEDIKHQFCPCCGNKDYPTGCEHVSTSEYIGELLDT